MKYEAIETYNNLVMSRIELYLFFFMQIQFDDTSIAAKEQAVY